MSVATNKFTVPVYATGPGGVHVGDVLAVHAVDWAIYTEQTPDTHEFKVVHGVIYGQVVAVTDDGFALAPQVFQDGDVRCTLMIPFVCVSSIEVLKAGAS